ncbi:uncharacterized protein LOC119067050 [Bradysia coprophila]|uniref:uncharacterized protein LOC119067050 n=1 Tax=Bradysia coprophila TaxID=38358 RepID=UPI00187DA989|nr:uncharacterized protein LOC119067050 [Bradysia coprophila]
MVKKTQWILLFTTFVISICSLIFVLVAFSVDKWIQAEAKSSEAIYENSQIHYGLFSGYLTRFIFATSPTYHKLTITCLYEENACIYSCQTSKDLREDELRRLLAGTGLYSCPTVPRNFEIKTETASYYTPTNDSLSLTLQRQNELNVADEVIDPGLWLTTIIFLSVAAMFSLISAVMALVNIVFNPVEPVLSVFGLYIWNGVASGCTLMTIILWGALFGSSLTQNIAVTDTLASEFTYSSDGLARLGFCYWLLLIPMVFHASNIGVLYWRKRIIEAEPPPPTITVDKSDLTIMLY